MIEIRLTLLGDLALILESENNTVGQIIDNYLVRGLLGRREDKSLKKAIKWRQPCGI